MEAPACVHPQRGVRASAADKSAFWPTRGQTGTMGKPGKFYCHYEAAEVTTPFVIEPGLTFAAVAEAFCAKYNAKHGAGPGEGRRCAR